MIVDQLAFTVATNIYCEEVIWTIENIYVDSSCAALCLIVSSATIGGGKLFGIWKADLGEQQIPKQFLNKATLKWLQGYRATQQLHKPL